MFETASIGVLSGAALVGAAGMQAARAMCGVVRRQQESSAGAEGRRAAFVNRLETAMHWARASQPTLRAWQGTRPFRIAAIVDETPQCRSFYLTPEDGRPLPRFEPGQYLTLHLPTADPMRPLVRCYSLSDRPRDDYYRVTVKRIGGPHGRPRPAAGRGSGYLHREAGPGSVLHAEAPQGAFFLDPTDELPVVLVGGGIGITPLVSMAAMLVHRGDARPAYLAVGFRNSREHPFRLQLQELATQAPSLRMDVSYSQPLAVDVEGLDFQHRGRVDLDHLKRVLPSNNFRFYLCGPAGMMESLVPGLIAWGVPKEHIHYEAFGPASVRGLCNQNSEPCNVQFARSGRLLPWTGEEPSLLALAERGGVALDSGCRAGNCGQCRVMIAAGRVAHAKPPGVQLVEGECLACIARPMGDVVVDA
jgi:ferredoxin-NADP reductase